MVAGTVPSTRRHAVYKYLGIITSIIASVAWLTTIVTLFSLWARDGFERYDYDDGEIAYISNVGARHKAVFVTGGAVTGVFYVLTLIFTKLSFDTDDQRRFRKGVSIVSIIFGILAALSLVLLASFDSVHYKVAHYTFTGLFLAFNLLSAIFSTIYRFTRKEVNLAVILRVLFISIVIPLAICFVVMSIIKRPPNQTSLKSVAASFEWTIAILFVMYLSLFALDLLLNKPDDHLFM